MALTNFFLDKYNRKYNMEKRLSLKAINSLQQYKFPGNVRELKNILKQGVVMHDEEVLVSEPKVLNERVENNSSQ